MVFLMFLCNNLFDQLVNTIIMMGEGLYGFKGFPAQCLVDRIIMMGAWVDILDGGRECDSPNLKEHSDGGTV